MFGAISRLSSLPVAVKITKCISLKGEMNWKKEIQIVKDLNHPFVIKFIEPALAVRNVVQVYELAHGGDLDSYINKKTAFHYQKL